LNLTRVDGAGNTFLLADLRELPGADHTRAVEDLQRGAAERCAAAGVDGLLLVGPGENDADASMVVVNRDGSRPEMCGNGLRCVAAFLARRGGPASLTIATDAGHLACEIALRDGETTDVRIAMGPATLRDERQPVSAGGRMFETVLIGNPHAVHFVAPGEDPEALAVQLGPAIERDPAYAPERTNVEFARVEPDGSLRLAVWERGVGLTAACGTGACAAAVAAVRTGRAPADRDLEVVLTGGTLTVHVPLDPTRSVVLTGPAREMAPGS